MCTTCGCGAGASVATPPGRGAPDWDLVLKRNNVERLKRAKFPLDLIDELPQLERMSYLDIPEEDMVRFQWYGLYHDKPRIGTFMLRIKVTNGSGIFSPAQYRTIGELAQRFGNNYTELATRQTVQLHGIQIKDLREIFAALERVGLTSLAGCGDTVRNTTGCPVAGLDPDELFDCRPVLREVVQFFLTHREYYDLPRKHKYTISTCAYQCNAPEINCIAFVGARQPGPNGSFRLGFAVRVGGGLSSTPRIARDLGVFVAPHEVLEVGRAITDLWREDLKYRLSRVKARLKFLVDDYGPEELRARVEARLGRRLEDLVEPPRPIGRTDHLGVHPQKQAGRAYIGFPVFLGQVTGEQTVQLADLAAELGGDVRITRQQNVILTGVPLARVDEVVGRVAEIGFPLEANRLRGTTVACTGQPYCNFAVAATKSKLREIVLRLEARFGREAEGLTIGVDGCPHACGHHWVTDIGLQGTTARSEGEGGKQEAYEIYLRGGLGEAAAIGRPILRRVPAEEAPAYVERLVAAYLAERRPGEPFQAFAQRTSDERLIAIAQGD